MPDNDAAMRSHAATTPMPEFDDPAFTSAPPLAGATVAIVTSAALHTEGSEGWSPNEDIHYSVLDDAERDLKLGHFSPNFDRGGFAADLNVVYPVDRLHELAERGVIGGVAPRHYAFAGNQPEGVSGIRLDTGPQVAKRLIEDGVQVVLLTPV